MDLSIFDVLDPIQVLLDGLGVLVATVVEVGVVTA